MESVVKNPLAAILKEVNPARRVGLAAECLDAIQDRRNERRLDHLRLLDEVFARSRSMSWAVGITGPPGGGKSSLLDRLLVKAIEREMAPSLIAIDPSSRISGGALLGDECRMLSVPRHRVFIRSIANRSQVGGISDRTFEAVTMLRALFSLVFVETVGVGQSETDVTGAVDTTGLLLPPMGGDTLQALKCGMMEMRNVLVVTKADLEKGRPAERALQDLRDTIAGSGTQDGFTPVPLSCSSAANTGIDEVWDELVRHREHLRSRISTVDHRSRQAEKWVWENLIRLYGLRRAPAIVGRVSDELPSVMRSRCQDAIREKIVEFGGPFQTLEHFAQMLD